MTVAAAAPSLLGHELRALTVGSVALVSLAAFEAMAVATAMPTVAAALDGLTEYALAFGLPLAAGVVGMVLAGTWSDSRGPAWPLRVGVLGFVAGLLIAATASSMTVLAAGRGVQGLGAGMFSVSLYVVVGHAVPEALRPKLFAWFAAAWVLPAVIGPAVSGLIVEHLGWRWVFALAVAVAVPAAIVVQPGLRGLDTGAGGRFDLRRLAWAVAAATGAAGLHTAGEQHGATAIAVGVVAAALVLVAGPRLLPAGTLVARRGLPTLVVLRGLLAAGFAGAEAFLPLMLARERGLSPALAGLALTLGAVTWAAGSWFQGRAGAPAPVTLLRAGALSLVIGIALATTAVLPDVPVAVAIIGWTASGLGMGLAYPTLSVLTLKRSAPGAQGANTSALQNADALFTSVVLAVSGAVFTALIGVGPVAFAAVSGIAALAASTAVLTAGRAET